jgi:hypothetical protein
MAINDKGEYANYWDGQPEDAIIFNQQSSGLERVMTYRVSSLSESFYIFVLHPQKVDVIPRQELRPLLNLLKRTGGVYI